MELLAHRGFWKDPKEKNTMVAFIRAFENGFGVETDLRDADGEIVIAHDLPRKNEIKFTDFLDTYKKMKSNTKLALNVKSDGLADLMIKNLESYGVDNYFAFDMSIPDTLHYMKKGAYFYDRLSEYETIRAFPHESHGIWLDAFKSEWYLERLEQIVQSANVCIVSSELHKRDHVALWKTMKALPASSKKNISLCTDFPDKAKELFL